MEIRDLKIIAYAEAYDVQKQLVEKVLHSSAPETLLLLEHFRVYTIRRGGDEKNLLDSSIDVVRINRGGGVLLFMARVNLSDIRLSIFLCEAGTCIATYGFWKKCSFSPPRLLGWMHIGSLEKPEFGQFAASSPLLEWEHDVG